MQFSFLIPALNEEKNIEGCISSIRDFAPAEYSYEVVVADHGSLDATAQIAGSLGAVVFTKHGGTVAELRNDLITNSKGDLLIFIDADIRLTPQWKSNIPKVFECAADNKMFISGSPCTPANASTFLNRHWFYPLSKKKKNYIGTGHMIGTRATFDKLSGFDSKLSSGEDYDLCARAKKLDIPVVSCKDLNVIHLDYPEKISDFMKREIWHGSGDFKSLSSFVSSKVAIASLLYLCVLVGLLVSVFLASKLAGSVFLIAIVLLPTLVSYTNLPSLDGKARAANIAISTLYLFSRSLSLFARGKKRRFYLNK